MARIVYAASGEGYGHAVRVHSVGACLLARGHDVRFFSCHKTQVYLRPLFGDRVHEVFGLSLTYREGTAKPVSTVFHNLRRAWADLGSTLGRLLRLLRSFKPDLVITDFEPFTAMWARRFGIPYISLDNQHLLTHCHVDRPAGFLRDVINAYLTIRFYNCGAQRYLIPTFIRAAIRFHPATLLDPILRPTVYNKSIGRGDFLLAYKGAEGENEAMRRVLEAYRRKPIRAYGFEVSGRRGGVTYKATTTEGFLDDLAECAGVIMSAGHSLASECLHLEKPMLLVPITRQFEQTVNAHYLEKMGAGRRVDRLSISAIDEFIDQLETYRSAIANIPKAKLDGVMEAIEREIP